VSELGYVKEVEVGGVFNLDKYENVRVSVRVVVNKPEDVGKVFDITFELAEKLGLIGKVLRRVKRMEEILHEKARRKREHAEQRRKDAAEAQLRAKMEAEKHLKKLCLDMFPEEVRKKVQEDPTNIFKLGLVSTECLYLRNIDEYLEEAKKLEEEAEKLDKEAMETIATTVKMRELIRQGKIGEAAEIAKKLWEKYEQLKKEEPFW